MPFKELNIQQQQTNNKLLSQSERNDTIVSNAADYSTFTKSFNQSGTFDSGKLIPILAQEVYPGDTYRIKSQENIKLSAPAGTPFNKINYDITYFYVPYQQIDKEFKYVLGENDEKGALETYLPFPTLNFDKAKVKMDTFYYTENDLANYFNIPINVDLGQKAGNQTHLWMYPFLAYGKIWNDWYRDQNLMGSIDVPYWEGDSRKFEIPDILQAEWLSMPFYKTIKYGKGLAPASKLPDYFTTTLPYRQKGSAIELGSSANFVLNPLAIGNGSSTIFTPFWYDKNAQRIADGGRLNVSNGKDSFTVGSTYFSGNKDTAVSGQAFLSLQTKETSSPFKEGSMINVNDLRESLVAQHYLENLALTGSRYVEQLKSMWKIEIDPLETDRTECIGGYSETLLFNNVQQTSETTGANQLGKIASSLYNLINGDSIEYTAKYYGMIMGILTVRTPINYGAQGLPKMFSYDEGLDLYNPMFANLGEQPITRGELYWTGDVSKDNKTFGFNEPFLHTKYNINNANGFLSLNSKTSLFPQFLYGEKQTDESAILSENWMIYNPNIIGNTLFNVSEGNKEFYHQFLFSIDFDITYTSQQPLYNTPGISKV